MKMSTSEIEKVPFDPHPNPSPQSFSTPLGSPEFSSISPIFISIPNHDQHDTYQMLSFMAIVLSLPSAISKTLFFLFVITLWHIIYLAEYSMLSLGKVTKSIIMFITCEIPLAFAIYLFLSLILSGVILRRPSVIANLFTCQCFGLFYQFAGPLAIFLSVLLSTYVGGFHVQFVLPLFKSAALGMLFWMGCIFILQVKENYYILHLFPKLEESVINEHIIRRLSSAPSPPYEMHSSLISMVRAFFCYSLNIGSSRRTLLQQFRYILREVSGVSLPSYIAKAFVDGFNEGPWLFDEEAEALHRRILDHTFQGIDRKKLHLQILESHLDSKMRRQFSSMVEVDEGGEVTSSALLRWIRTVRQSHFMLRKAQKNRRSILAWLDMMGVTITCTVVLLLMFIGMFQVKLTVIGVGITQFVSLLFITSDWAKRYFESIIYICVNQPFIIGDQCMINDKKVIIEDICIPRTTVRRLEDNRVICYANTELSKLPIINCTRDASENDQIEFFVRYLTEEQMTTLTAQIESYMGRHKNCWKSWSLSLKDIKEKDKVKMAVKFQHSILVEEVRERRKEQLSSQIVKICAEGGFY